MLKREEKALKELIAKLKIPEAMPHSSQSNLEDGIDRGREDAADELEYLLGQLAKLKTTK